MIVASMIEIAINHGLKRGFHSSGCDAAVSALMLAPFEPCRSTAPRPRLRRCQDDRPGSDFSRSTNLPAYGNGWNHRHARTQPTFQVPFISEYDPPRPSVDHL